MPERLTARFEVVSGPDHGLVLLSCDAFIIGRAADVQLRTANDHEVSYRHAFVNNDGTMVQITDLGSANGTWIGTHRLHQSTTVQHGDRIRVGNTEIAVSIGHGEHVATGAASGMFGPLWSQLPAPPTRWFGHLKIVREIGRGGMGIVYQVESPDGTHLAAKVIQPKVLTTPEVRGRFLREARIHCQLDHNKIVRAHEITEASEGVFCLVMDYIDGGNAEQLLNEAPNGLPAGRVVEIASDVLEALAYAHSRGLVHRDVKTANVLIDRKRRSAMLTDFGLAKAYESSGASGGLTVSGMTGGTPMFAAPEQLKDFRSARPAADIYGVGALAYRLLTAALPYDLHGENELTAVMLHPLVPVRVRKPSAPAGLAAVIDTALARDPAHRYPAAEVMAAALRRAIS